MNYYISDLHFSHYNVMAKYDKRPFATTQEMDATMMKNWNNIVTDDDTVYILGDFSWETQEGWKSRLEALHGNKVLIIGNHDFKRMKGASKLFVDIKPYLEINDRAYRVIMCHYPILAYNRDYADNVFMLYGHTHVSEEEDMIKEFITQIRARYDGEYSVNRGQIINVGCMMPYMNYTPRTMEYLANKFKSGETGTMPV